MAANNSITITEAKRLARNITLVENELAGYEELLRNLDTQDTPVIGITGSPGAGKSTLTDALVGVLVAKGHKVGVLCVDPSSPFNLGAILGDRIRMSEWYVNPSVFIRSLGSRGNLGGLQASIIEITDVMKAAGFDYIIVETVGVGQSEVEIAGLADVTVVVLVPEGGDEIQTMKAGIMEIADIFVVNKADRPGADSYIKNLAAAFSPAMRRIAKDIPIVKTVASQKGGIDELYEAIKQFLDQPQSNERKELLMADRAYHLIQKSRMKGVTRQLLFEEIRKKQVKNLYAFIAAYGADN